MATPPPPIPSRIAGRMWRLCLLAGLVTAVLFAWLHGQMPRTACGLADAAVLPVTHFKLALTETDMALLFGAYDAPCAMALAAAFDHVNWPDLLAFAPVYGLFLFGFVHAFLPPARHPRLLAFVIGLLAAAWCGDMVETMIQLRLTAALPGSDMELWFLGIAGRCNYLGLSLLALVCGVAGLMRADRAEQATGAALTVSAAVAVLTLLGIAPLHWLTPALALGWIAMLALAGWRSVIPHLRLDA